MKKYLIKLCLSLLLLILVATFHTKSIASDSTKISTKTINSLDSTEASNLIVRLNEIKAEDKTNLTKVEKRSLRKEVLSIKHRLRERSGGIYLSLGAVIIIILLLIILL